MEFKALFTGNITIADKNDIQESIRINIEGDDTFNTFRAKVLEACTFYDYRAHQQGFRLFEDTDLVATLTPEELAKCEEAARLLFPNKNLPKVSQLREGVKFEVAKLTGVGESLTLQIHNPDSYEDVITAMTQLWQLLDQRLAARNTRQLKHLDYVKNLDGNTKLKVAMIMDILYGRATIEGVMSRLESGTTAEEYIQEQLKNDVAQAQK
jgi:hypothetical protein